MLMSIGDFPESLNQAISAGIMSVGRLGVGPDLRPVSELPVPVKKALLRRRKRVNVSLWKTPIRGLEREGFLLLFCRAKARLKGRNVFSTDTGKILDFRGVDSSRILILRGGIPRPMKDFLESSSHEILVRRFLIWRLAVGEGKRLGRPGWPYVQSDHAARAASCCFMLRHATPRYDVMMGGTTCLTLLV